MKISGDLVAVAVLITKGPLSLFSSDCFEIGGLVLNHSYFVGSSLKKNFQLDHV